MPHRSLLTIFTVALLMATLAVPNLQAQQEEEGQRREERGRGGFGRGFGGFGGFGGGGGMSSPLTWLGVEAVRNELKVTEDQKELIDILRDEIRESRPEFDFRNFRDMSEEERAEVGQKLEKWNTETTAQAKETLKTILDEGQYKRLEEIHLQTQGVNALVSDDVAKALSLTPEQVAKLKETQEANSEASRTAMRDAFQPGGDRDAIREKMETLRKENDAKMLAHLTAEQQAAFTALKGEPFEMPPDAFGFGRRGGRGGPGGPGGGGDGDRPQRPERPE